MLHKYSRIKDVRIKKFERKNALYIEITKDSHTCPFSHDIISKVYDNRIQRIIHING
ncbi:hypothetical protein KZO01_26420 [Kurthia zopfii]|nr:hypothetical protein KZO01_26420 [Kurthia zopfii]